MSLWQNIIPPQYGASIQWHSRFCIREKATVQKHLPLVEIHYYLTSGYIYICDKVKACQQQALSGLFS